MAQTIICLVVGYGLLKACPKNGEGKKKEKKRKKGI